MILCVIFALAFGLGLALYRPATLSLKDLSVPSLSERVKSVGGTMVLGLILILVYFFTSYGSGWDTADSVIINLSNNYEGVLEQGQYYRLFTSIFVHIDWIHLASNLLALALCSAFERARGTKRFFTVFIFSALFASTIEIFSHGPGYFSVGASGGIFGLAAAYFMEVGIVNTTWRRWLFGTASILGLALLLSFGGSLENSRFKVDHVAHILGALGGLLFCLGGQRRDAT